MTLTVTLDKIASSTKNANISRVARISKHVVAREGFVVAARVLSRRSSYNTLEDLHGRMMALQEGDVIAGVLGHRSALRGFCGEVPESINVGDRLSILNLGGVIGKCTSSHAELGEPIAVEILGSVLAFSSMDERVGIPAHVLKGEVAPAEALTPHNTPIVFVSGTCMNAGKTTVCAALIRHLSRRGLRIVSAKVTGVSLLRDTLSMLDHGAVKAFSFMDAGIVTTDASNILPGVKGILNSFHRHQPDLCIVELGDGIFGEYGVAALLTDPEIKALKQLHICCASDPVGAWGMLQSFTHVYKHPIAAISGPVTDNAVGTDFIHNQLGLPAFNARHQAEILGEHIWSLSQSFSEAGTRVA